MSRNVLIIVGIIVVGATGALCNMAAAEDVGPYGKFIDVTASFDMDFSCGVK